jgi:putative exosortase-associated protein (TIGR04073 family)
MIRKIVFVCMAMVLLSGSSSLAVVCKDRGYADDHITPICYWRGVSTKLVRGVTNTVTFPFEIPKQMVMTTLENPIAGPVIGVFVGVGMGVSRLIYGVAEIATFLLPNDLDDWNFNPIFEPDYVWHSEE